MGHYRQQEIDFVTRTTAIIKQYEKLNIDKKEKYEVTLLINCFVGLLILPQQLYQRKQSQKKKQLCRYLPADATSKKEWGIDPKHIFCIKSRHQKDEKKSIVKIAKHLRNSIAHYNFSDSANAYDYMSSIKFKDFDADGNLTFDATIPLADLRKFIYKLSDWFIDEMKKQ